ncbi:ABC transporter family substrate-binding protein [Streptomyces liangshanensis]|uniref:ABC transporter family substrate-binding protein n=1 Tax=Streptomyces liangshanensis TaxID=2717324 RepID=UPI0036D7B516
MSHVGAPRGRTCSRTLRTVSLLTTGVLALTVLSACTAEKPAGRAQAAPVDIGSTGRDAIAQGGTVRWAVDTMPATLNVFQADSDATTNRIAGAVLPTLFTLDRTGSPQRNGDYLESAKIVDREPKQVVVYKLNQQAVWSDGTEIGAPDFVAQWHALRGKDTAYWTARNAGYERIEKIERGKDDLDVRVTFDRPYADWKSLFTPLYPKEVMGSPTSFNDGARAALKTSAGPFNLKSVDRKAKKATLVRNPRWWGKRAKLDSIVLSAVPRSKRAEALAAGGLDLADIDRAAAERISSAARAKGGTAGQPLTHGPGAADISPAASLRARAMAHGSDKEKAEAARSARERTAEAAETYSREQRNLRGYVVRKSLEPAYTQLALNGESGPLADERVRRAVARAINRKQLADAVLKPLGLPSKPLGSHLAVAGQPAYADSSDALGTQDTHEAQALLADAGWTQGGARRTDAGTKAGSEGEGSKPADAGKKSPDAETAKKDGEKKETAKEDGDKKTDAEKKADKTDKATEKSAEKSGKPEKPEKKSDTPSDEGAYTVGDNKPAQDTKPGGVAGAYAPRGTAVPAPKAGPLGKDGKTLTLRFVLPSGEGSESLRAVGRRISVMLDRIGIGTETIKVADNSYFKDHIAAGDYDLALYSWPATAYPATDGRPIFAKPVPASDGTLLVEQNYTRVGTDHIDQLFDQAASELDEGEARDLMKKADARIWAAAGSIPLYQRPQLVATKPALANAGAFGFTSPRYQDIGFKKSGNAGPTAVPTTASTAVPTALPTTAEKSEKVEK